MPKGEAHDLGGLVDGEPVLKGQVVRVVTTGGGGWGDPLQRELELVLRDVVEGRVSLASAGSGLWRGVRDAGVDRRAIRDRRGGDRGGAAPNCAKARTTPLPMIDRGEGYEKMLRGEHRPRMR